jgi:predicted small lipoprotein YifL
MRTFTIKRSARTALAVLVLSTLAACGSKSNADELPMDAPTTTLDPAAQTAADEQLFRLVAYEGQQLLSAAAHNKETFKASFDFDTKALFPPYREYLTDAMLQNCLQEQLDQYSTFYIRYMVPQLGSSIPTPDWIFELSDGKTFKPSDFGRTYMIRVKYVDVGIQPGEKDVDIHYSIIDGTAYYFTNFDYCRPSS